MNRLLYLIKKIFIHDTNTENKLVLEQMTKEELIDYFGSKGIKIDKRYKAETILKKYKKFLST